MEREKLPRWAQERLDVDEAMGQLEDSAPPGVVVAGTLYIAFCIGLLVLFCVIVYLIGKAVVG